MTTSISVSKAKGGLSDVLNHVAYGKERIVVSIHGKPKAAVISMDDLYLLEELEDAMAAREARAEYECVVDGKSAIRWVRWHAGNLGIDPGRIAAGGGSAGAHVATAAATVSGFDEDGEDCSVSARPDALVLFNPVFDNGPGGFGHDRVKERWQDFSPLHNVAEGVPPSIVFLGAEDSLIPVSTAQEFKKRVSKVGARCDVWTYEGQPHGFFNYRDGNNPYYNATVCKADRFLASLGFLDGEPALQSKAVKATRL